jgi:hypothetical protein
MTKTENRAAAKAFRQEKERKWREEEHAQAVAADLEELRRIRHYLSLTRRPAYRMTT